MARVKQRYFSSQINPQDGTQVTEEFRNVYEWLRNPEVALDGAFYFGDRGTDGSWRLIRSGNDLVVQRRESGTWTTKSTFTP